MSAGWRGERLRLARRKKGYVSFSLLLGCRWSRNVAIWQSSLLPSRSLADRVGPVLSRDGYVPLCGDEDKGRLDESRQFTTHPRLSWRREISTGSSSQPPKPQLDVIRPVVLSNTLHPLDTQSTAGRRRSIRLTASCLASTLVAYIVAITVPNFHHEVILQFGSCRAARVGGWREPQRRRLSLPSAIHRRRPRRP